MSSLSLPFRAIFVFDTLDLGGAERQGLMLARHLKEHCGADVQVWGLTGGPGRLAELCDEAGIAWRAVRLQWHHEPVASVLNLPALGRLAARLRAQRPTAILPYTFFSNMICGLVWRLTGAELCVWNQRDAGFFLDGINPWRSAAGRFTPYFVANSEEGRRAVVAAFGRPVTVVHNGVSLAPPRRDRAAWRAALGLDADTFAACMVANVHSSKDHLTLLRAWRALLDRVDSSPVLLLAGRLDAEAAPVLRLAETLAFGASVRFLGAVDDVPGLLRAVDLCVHSSRTEGLPNGVLEAMASGLPVVATDLPGIREAVGQAGFRHLTPPKDAATMSSLIEAFLRDPVLRANVGHEAERRVQDRFGAAKMCQTMVSYLAERREHAR